MKIYVQSPPSLPNPHNEEFNVDLNTEIKSLAELAAGKFGVDPKKLKLCLGENRLNEGGTVASCSLVEGCTLNSVVERTIIIKYPSGRSVEYPVEPNTQIKDLSDIASHEINIPFADQIKLLYEGQLLEDNNTIESCKLPDGCLISATLVLTAGK
ncbi:hypothetical protein M9Y10_002815 [Tritrichomonas musculus]|uniref:Ubiquitin-like domain-containing protein n=1 Tax=Tritrichomonas musculus TaxID=1915356 RepID=A0ABR2LAY2_9EUKA